MNTFDPKTCRFSSQYRIDNGKEKNIEVAKEFLKLSKKISQLEQKKQLSESEKKESQTISRKIEFCFSHLEKEFGDEMKALKFIVSVEKGI